MTTRRSAAVLASVLASVLAVSFNGTHALAHTITVDGSAADWFTRAANPAGARNVGIIARNAAGQGEFVWDDATGDARTDLSGGGPEVQADISRVQVTATPQFLALLIQAGPPASTGNPVQIQIAIDTNRTSGSGTVGLPGFSGTDVAAGAAWERVIRTRLRGTAPAVDVFDPTYTLVAPTTGNPPRIARGNTGTIEITIPWSMLGLNTPPAVLRFSIASFQEAANGDVVQLTAPPHVLDVVSNYGDPRASAYPNTFAEFSNPASSVLDYSFDVHFNTGLEVIAPALITRVVPNSTGTTGTPWIEVTSNASVAIATNTFKIGNAAVIDGTATTLLFPSIGAGTLSPAGVLRLAQNGPNLMTRFMVAASAEWTAQVGTIPDLTPYNFWSSGTMFAMTTAGDTLLLLDSANTVIDEVNWGTGTFTGVTAFPTAPVVDQALIRTGTTDTDNCASDFTLSTVTGVDAGVPDTGVPDTGTPDTGTPDVGTPDTGMSDTGTPDVGTLSDVVVTDIVTVDVPATDVPVSEGGQTDTGTVFEGGLLDDSVPFDSGTSDTGISPTDATRRDVVVADTGAEAGPAAGGCKCSTPGHSTGGSRGAIAALAVALGLLVSRKTPKTRKTQPTRR